MSLEVKGCRRQVINDSKSQESDREREALVWNEGWNQHMGWFEKNLSEIWHLNWNVRKKQKPSLRPPVWKV